MTTYCLPNCTHTLKPISTTEKCEMGDEEGCEHTAVYLLHAPMCYTRPLLCCDDHGSDEIYYGGAMIVAPEGLSEAPVGVVVR